MIGSYMNTGIQMADTSLSMYMKLYTKYMTTYIYLVIMKVKKNFFSLKVNRILVYRIFYKNKP